MASRCLEVPRSFNPQLDPPSLLPLYVPTPRFSRGRRGRRRSAPPPPFGWVGTHPVFAWVATHPALWVGRDPPRSLGGSGPTPSKLHQNYPKLPHNYRKLHQITPNYPKVKLKLGVISHCALT